MKKNLVVLLIGFLGAQSIAMAQKVVTVGSLKATVERCVNNFVVQPFYLPERGDFSDSSSFLQATPVSVQINENISRTQLNTDSDYWYVKYSSTHQGEEGRIQYSHWNTNGVNKNNPQPNPFFVNYSSTFGNVDVHLTLPDGFPTLVYDIETKCTTTYDQWGNPVKKCSTSAPINIAVILPKTHGPKVPFINLDSGVASQKTVDTMAMAECLKAGF